MSKTKKLNWFLFAWAVGAIMLNGPADRNENMLAITFIFLAVASVNMAAISYGLSTGKISGFLEASIMSGIASWTLINLPFNQTWMLWGLALASIGFWFIGLSVDLITKKAKGTIFTKNAGSVLPQEPNNLASRDAESEWHPPQYAKSVSKTVTHSSRQYTYPAISARFSFSNVVGMDDLKAKLRKAGDDVMVFINMGRKSRNKAESPRNGILLSGDPGNGKTFFSEALAGELKLPIVIATFGEMASQWVGETTKNAMQVFNDAEAQAPCVLFLDEIDSVLGKRDGAVNSDSESPKTTNAILTRLVDIRSKGVLVIAATNFIDKLDRAAIREGRFDYKIEVPPPDMPARKSILEKTIKGKLSGIAIEDGVLDRASKRWEGFSVARIQAIAKEVVEMVKANESPVSSIGFGMLTDALRTVQGSRGTRLSENAPTLDQLIMGEKMATTLKGIAHRMIHIESVEEMGGSVPGGILFYGPPGTGKTYTAQALAKTTDWAFLSTSGQDLLSKPERIDEILATAKDIRPCIVMIDEADDVLADRTTSPWSKSITNKLLQAIDGAGGRTPDIVFVAATNHPEAMDSAALRGGRFTEKIEFALPDKSVVAIFVQKWIDGTKAKVEQTLTAETVAEFIGEVSLANVKEIMQASVNTMIGRRTGEHDALVTMQDVGHARKTVLGD